MQKTKPRGDVATTYVALSHLCENLFLSFSILLDEAGHIKLTGMMVDFNIELLSDLYFIINIDQIV